MNYIKINDPVYGPHIIKEEVLCELIKSDAIKRLKNISQQGVPPKYYYKEQYSRQEHSLGCLILCDLFNGTLEEKIACLLHDVSHTAFSHIYDFVLDNYNEDYQDSIFFDFIKNDSQIPNILEKYNIDINKFQDLTKFKLLDKPRPQTCIDRLDYSLREFYYIKQNKDFIKNIIYNIKITPNQEIIFNTKSAASDFANAYLYLFLNRWNSKESIDRQIVFTNILKLAIQKNLILKEDFQKDDNYILNIIENTDDQEIKKKLKELENNTYKLTKEEENKKKKLRYINPKYFEENTIKDLISNDPTYKTKIENILKQYE